MLIGIAGAGAGKTTAMVDTIVRLREGTDKSKHIFALLLQTMQCHALNKNCRIIMELSRTTLL